MDEQVENTQQPQEGNPEIMIDDIIKVCFDAPGYILFAATLASDQKGNPILNFNYRKYNLNTEDVKIAFINLATTLKEEEGLDPISVLKKGGL